MPGSRQLLLVKSISADNPAITVEKSRYTVSLPDGRYTVTSATSRAVTSSSAIGPAFEERVARLVTNAHAADSIAGLHLIMQRLYPVVYPLQNPTQ